MLHYNVVFFAILFKKKDIFHYGVPFGPCESNTRNGFCYGIKNIQSMIVGKFKKPDLLSQGRLNELLTTTKTVKREIMLERDVPAEHGNAVTLRYAF